MKSNQDQKPVRFKRRDFSLILLFLLSLGMVVGVTTQANPNVLGPHGGMLLDKDGKQFELVKHADDNGIELYAPKREASAPPSSMTVVLKNKKKLLERVHLSLSPSDDINSGSHYTGQVPSRILISGGVTFDLEF